MFHVENNQEDFDGVCVIVRVREREDDREERKEGRVEEREREREKAASGFVVNPIKTSDLLCLLEAFGSATSAQNSISLLNAAKITPSLTRFRRVIPLGLIYRPYR